MHLLNTESEPTKMRKWIGWALARSETRVQNGGGHATCDSFRSLAHRVMACRLSMPSEATFNHVSNREIETRIWYGGPILEIIQNEIYLVVLGTLWGDNL